MERLRVQTFGVGDGEACGDRNHSSFLYRLAGTAVLVDCGEPVSRSYKAAGLAYDLVDAIFLSHLHFDHVGGLFMLLQGFWLEKRRKPLRVHMPEEGIEAVERMLKAGYLFRELFSFELDFVALTARQPVEVGGLRVTPFPTTHLERLRAGFQATYPTAFEAFSFLLEGDGLRVGHSGDIGAASDLAPLVGAPLDLLVCELSHAEPEELCGWLGQHRIGRVAFTHLGRPYWERLEETRREVAALLPRTAHLFLQDQQEIAL